MGFITLNKSHFFHNLEQITRHAGDINKVAIVLKDNAYGHGLLEIATLCQKFGIKHAVVRNIEEATLVSDRFKTILVLAQLPKEAPLEHIHITINDLNDLERLQEETSIELKCDTGMHRNGVTLDELEKAFERIAARRLKLKGVFTHHRSADELSSEFFWQEKQFETIIQSVTNLCAIHRLPMPRFHSANSAALFRSHTQHDLVRVGIAAYGLLRLPQSLPTLDLRPVLSLWAERLHVQDLQTGNKVGYGGTKRIALPTLAATYDIGYGDGLLRLNDSQSYTAPNGALLLGRISMDNMLFSSQEATMCIFDDAQSYAQAAETISYEVIVRLAPNIARKVID